MPKTLLPHQKEAIELLRTGSILQGGVGSGKSLTSLVYFFKSQGGSIGDGEIHPEPSSKKCKDLYIITTARKRDSLDWEKEATALYITKDRDTSINNIKLTVDSWNNIKKYVDVENAFFIFDEQKVVGSGTWAKTFVKIARKNDWILLTATPGDTWSDYIAVFVANGFYRNRTAFMREHVVYSSFTMFPKIVRYLDEEKLERLKRKITIVMNYERKTVHHKIDVLVPYDDKQLRRVAKDRWNIFKDEPIKNAAEACYVMRKVVNKNEHRIHALERISKIHGRLIVFYNFDYELEMLRQYGDSLNYPVAEYNGHLHEDLPTGGQWLYYVQYTSGAEAWNCITTNAIVFFSANYSYKIVTQASGRIDRWNTPYTDLYYYFIITDSLIDHGIIEAQKNKTEFNERRFTRELQMEFF